MSISNYGINSLVKMGQGGGLERLPIYPSSTTDSSRNDVVITTLLPESNTPSSIGTTLLWLGDSTHYIDKAYITEIHGNLHGTAQMATKDANSNNIVDTYATKANTIKSLSANGNTITYTMGDNNTTGTITIPDTDTKNTAGSTDSSSKLYLVGATSQAANPQTYSNANVYETDGVLHASSFDGDVTGDVTGNADTATQLETARSFSITGGATASAVSFNGSGNVELNVSNVKEEVITSNPDYWSNGSLTLINRKSIDFTRANKMAFIPASMVSISYSTDGGSTWTDAGYSDEAKAKLFASNNTGSITVGPNDSDTAVTTSLQTRIDITKPSDLSFYSSLEQLFIWFASIGHAVVCDMYISRYGTPSTFTNVFTNRPISGWSGANMLNFSTILFGGTEADHVYTIRLVFRITGVNTSSNYAYVKPFLYSIRGFGPSSWPHGIYVNNMSKADHLYQWDYSQNAIFPAKVTATSGFVGNLSGTANKATADASGNTISSTYIKELSVLGSTITYTKGNGDTGTITTQDTNTHYTSKNVVTGLANGNTDTTTALTNGNVYLNHLEEQGVISSHKITGSGATTVTSDSDGNIIISSTNSSYTGNNGVTVSGSTISASLVSTNLLGGAVSEATDNANRRYPVSLDSAGKLAVVVPWTDSNTTYSAGTGLTLSGTTFKHSNSVTAGTAGTSSATSGSTLAVPYVTYDAQGHVTASGTHTHTVSGFIPTSGTSALAGNIIPSTNNSYALGSSSYKFSNVYATTFTGALSGNATTATEASHVTNSLDIVFNTASGSTVSNTLSNSDTYNGSNARTIRIGSVQKLVETNILADTTARVSITSPVGYYDHKVFIDIDQLSNSSSVNDLNLSLPAASSLAEGCEITIYCTSYYSDFKYIVYPATGESILNMQGDTITSGYVKGSYGNILKLVTIQDRTSANSPIRWHASRQVLYSIDASEA